MFIKLLVLLIFILSIVGCSNEEPPADSHPGETKLEVNDENCKPENLRQIENRIEQQEFSSKCIHRTKFQKSIPKSWQ